MDILYLLIPMSSLLVLGIVGIFAWALARGQFDDLDQEGARILDEAQGPSPVPLQHSTLPSAGWQGEP
jgi:cbb3-type cytochrome oxidase maturation protein